MKKKLKDVAEIIFCILEKGNEEKKLLTPANLLENNQISTVNKDDKFKKDKSVIIKKDDILLKRINPTYINYIEDIGEDIYAGNNLIIIRAKEINAKYLAAILNMNIEKFVKKNSVGAIIPSIGRKMVTLRNWMKTIEKRKLELKKIELERQKSMVVIKNFINEIGGNKND